MVTQSQLSSTFVNILQEAPMRPNPLIPLARTTIRHRSGRRPKGEPHSPYSPCLCGNAGEGMIFQSQETSTIVTFTTPASHHLSQVRGSGRGK